MREAEAGRLLGRRGRPIKPSTLLSDKGRIEAHVKPLIGNRAMRSLSLRDIEEMQANIAAGKTAKKQSGKRRIRGSLPTGGGGVGRSHPGDAAGDIRARRSPTADQLEPRQGCPQDSQQEAYAPADPGRPSRVRRGNADREGKPHCPCGPSVAGDHRFQAQRGVGASPGMAGGSRGGEFPDTKTGPQLRPIGRVAVELIKKQIARAGDSEWVFPADRGEGHFIGAPRVLARIAKRAKLKVTLHVFRHTFASVAAEIGFSELTIAGLLGHSAGSVTSGYVHLDAALVVAADRVASTIADALDGKAKGKVLPMKRKARQ